MDVCDFVVDNCAPFGDAGLEVEGLPEKIVPMSGVATIATCWMIHTQVVEKLLARGLEPSFFLSLNRPEGRGVQPEDARAVQPPGLLRECATMSAEAYFDACEAGLAKLRAEQMENIRAAATLLADTIADGRAVFAFGASHSFMLPMELCYRTGGLMLINPIYPHGMDLGVRPLPMTSQIERIPDYGRVLLENSPAREGDALLIASTSGRNAVVIDMALAARERGISIIGVTSVEYSTSVPSRHPSGKRMLELCDVVVDNCAPLGDAAVAVPGVEQKTGPLSSVLGLRGGERDRLPGRSPTS
jgi:uncharacterized phosphosugar-binding protein